MSQIKDIESSSTLRSLADLPVYDAPICTTGNDPLSQDYSKLFTADSSRFFALQAESSLLYSGAPTLERLPLIQQLQTIRQIHIALAKAQIQILTAPQSTLQ